MKIINPGNPDAPMPHKCDRNLWEFARNHRVHMYMELHCPCGYLWKLLPKVSVWKQLFSEYHIQENAHSAYWVRTGFKSQETEK